MSKRPPRRGATLAKAIIEEYQPKSVEDMQNALKEIFGPMFEAMLNGEMENHLGYMSNERGERIQQIAATDIPPKSSKPQQARFPSACQETVTALLHRKSFPKDRPTSRPLKEKCSRCMPEE